MALIHCIYCSAATDRNFSSDDLARILETSRVNNAALGITGILLFENGSFFQILEGEADVIDELYQRIRIDPRHHKVSLVFSEPIEERTFGEWSMAYPDISIDDIQTLPHLNDFFANERSFLDVGNDVAREFLDAFRKGHWHVNEAGC